MAAEMTTPKRGKPCSGSRAHFTMTDNPGGKPRVKCNHCEVCCDSAKTKYLAVCCTDVEVLRIHMRDCHPELITTPPKQRKRQHSELEENQVIHWSSQDNEEANKLLAQFIFECGLAFNIVEHPAFSKFVSKLNNNFKPVSSQTIGNKYVDESYERAQNLVQRNLENKTVVLSVDQSKDRNGEPIAHVVAIPPSGVPLLLKEVPHYTEDHTAQNLLSVVDECVQELEDMNSTVCGIINDNEPKSLCLRNLFREKYYHNTKHVHTPGVNYFHTY